MSEGERKNGEREDGVIAWSLADTLTLPSSSVPPHAGVMLGTNDEQLVGMHIGEIVTGMAGAPIGNLFLPELGRGPKAISKMKGGLKQDTGEGMDVVLVTLWRGEHWLTSHAPTLVNRALLDLPPLMCPSLIPQPRTRRPRKRSLVLSTPSRCSTSPTANRWASPCRCGGCARYLLSQGEKKEAE